MFWLNQSAKTKKKWPQPFSTVTVYLEHDRLINKRTLMEWKQILIMCWKIFVLKMKSVLSCLNRGQTRAVKGGVALKGSLHLCCYLSHSLPPRPHPPSPTSLQEAAGSFACECVTELIKSSLFYRCGLIELAGLPSVFLLVFIEDYIFPFHISVPQTPDPFISIPPLPSTALWSEDSLWSCV